MDAHWLSRAVATLLLMLCGCSEAPCPIIGGERGEATSERETASQDYCERETGSIRGRVVWSGPLPSIPAFKIFGVAGMGTESLKERPNPHVPIVEKTSGGVAGAVVFLRNADVAKARPWNHPPVHVEFSRNLISIFQGEAHGSIGFVRRGDVIDIVNRDPYLHVLSVNGADFFSLPFPDKDKPSKRRLDHRGALDLTGGAGYFWMSAHLFVADHPYYTRTDVGGDFLLEKVPARRYELVCWLPHWEITGTERDPELGLVHRVFYRRALERVLHVDVPVQKTAEAEFSLSLKAFE
ncbi:MAG: hypothetical protein HY040_22060 [Planctomycetes bacterium]|nr:hypothetical protein [Planctomycetota bacterium]